MLTFSSGIVCSQVPSAKVFPTSSKKYPGSRETTSKVKWSWQVPVAVRNAFNNSQHADWYIEKIIRYDSSGEIRFRFHINNGSLLDADHYDNFLEKGYLEVSGSGIIFCRSNL
jgi:hypothetical protein